MASGQLPSKSDQPLTLICSHENPIRVHAARPSPSPLQSIGWHAVTTASEVLCHYPLTRAEEDPQKRIRGDGLSEAASARLPANHAVRHTFFRPVGCQLSSRMVSCNTPLPPVLQRQAPHLTGCLRVGYLLMESRNQPAYSSGDRGSVLFKES